MIEKEVTIINKLGLHARAAAKFVGTSGRFGSSVRVRKGAQEVDGKSILAVMMLAASKGTALTLQTDGEDETEAMEAILALINNFFEEGE
jgi:phosphocarrier protein HPr